MTRKLHKAALAIERTGDRVQDWMDGTTREERALFDRMYALAEKDPNRAANDGHGYAEFNDGTGRVAAVGPTPRFGRGGRMIFIP